MNSIQIEKQPRTGSEDHPAREKPPTAATLGVGGTKSEPKWAIDCTDPKLRPELRERFERLAAQAAKFAAYTVYEHRFEAVDAWLDLLKDDARFGHEWKIIMLLTASIEHCEDLKLRALANQDRDAVHFWSEIEHRFRSLAAANPHEELYAIDNQAGEPDAVVVPAPKPSSNNPAATESRRSG
jgi:hypothetical protein